MRRDETRKQRAGKVFVLVERAPRVAGAVASASAAAAVQSAASEGQRRAHLRGRPAQGRGQRVATAPAHSAAQDDGPSQKSCSGRDHHAQVRQPGRGAFVAPSEQTQLENFRHRGEKTVLNFTHM